MELKDYTTEQLRAELKRRSDELKAEKAKVKRCRMCKHWGEITYWGTPVTDTTLTGGSNAVSFFQIRQGDTTSAMHHPSLRVNILKNKWK